MRVVAATNREPLQAVAEGRLREDLIHRLKVFPIVVPPLRERLEDVPLLAAHFVQALGQQEGHAKRLSAEALHRLGTYRWPGNVRELRNVVQRAYVMAARAVIDGQWLPDDHTGSPRPFSAQPITAPSAETPATASATVTLSIGLSMAQVERTMILATMAHHQNHRARAAAVLGISLKTLYNRLKDCAAQDDTSDATR